METLHEIKQAIGRLPRAEQFDLEEWIREFTEARHGVSEARPQYATEQPRYLSVEEYLKFEETSATRHEYIGGELFAMTGATKRHNVICLNIAIALQGHLQGGPCRTYIEAVKVRLTAKGDEIFYYPDIAVACGTQDQKEAFLVDPKLIVEVLSPGTARIDRCEKARNYREIPAFAEYLLIEQGKPEVTLYRRSENWIPQVLTRSDVAVELRSLTFTLPLDRIYDGVLLD